MVYLGTRVNPWSDVPAEDPVRRLLTPDVVLFDIETQLDDAGRLRYNVTYIPDRTPAGFSDRPQFVAVDVTGRILYSTKTTLLGDFGTLRKAAVPALGSDTEVKLFIEHAAMIESEDFTGIAHADFARALRFTLGDLIEIFDHTPGDLSDILIADDTAAAPAADSIQVLGGDAIARAGRWSVESLGFHDTTYVVASGDRDWVVFGEGSIQPVGRVIMYDAVADVVSGSISIDDLLINGSETVRGVGLNHDGTLGVALGSLEAAFFSTDLRLQGTALITPGGAGAALHPLHANSKSVLNSGGVYLPDTHLSFVGSGDRTIDIIDTFHFNHSGRIYIKDVPAGPLQAVLPFPEDNVGLTCALTNVVDNGSDDRPGRGDLPRWRLQFASPSDWRTHRGFVHRSEAGRHHRPWRCGGGRRSQERRSSLPPDAQLGPVNTTEQFVVYWGYENHRVPISSDRGLLSTSARQCEPLQSRSA